jgi:general nucleoside transport system ATP-binding protein
MPDETIIEMKAITKRFSGVVANDNIDFELKYKEVHTILGENGAGKTTLMNILSGMYQPDKGEIYVNGQKVHIRSPHDSLKHRIGMVYQHFALIPTLTVLENIVLGFEGGALLNLAQAEKKLKELSEQYDLFINFHQKVSDISVGERQLVEIIKVLYHGSDALILDEPTSVITPQEAERLFKIVESLRDTGKAVVLITHRLSEALDISNRISILRLGKKIAELPGDALRDMGYKNASEKILKIMFGDMPIPESPKFERKTSDQIVLELEKVRAINNRSVVGLKDVSVKIMKGEIFGIAGVDGNGQKSFAEVIGGQKKVISGHIRFKGKNITKLSTNRRLEKGICYITDDRMGEGCVLDMDLAENSILQFFYQKPYSLHTIINMPLIHTFADSLLKKFNIKANGSLDRIGTLSGGNIQKFILARGLNMKPDLIVCNKPTHGLDARTVHFIQESLLKESANGVSILLISSDMDELLNYSDRIGVLFNGELLDILDRCDATPEKIGKSMLGIKN